MSTQVVCVDEADVNRAIQAVRTAEGEDTKQRWCLLGHVDGDPTKITLAGEGTGCDSLIAALRDEEVVYGLLRMSETIDMSETVKFVYIHWIGESVTKKGRYGVMHGSVQQFFPASHHAIETSSRDDLSAEVIMNTINETSGTKSKVLDSEAADALPKRGFTSVPMSGPPRGGRSSGPAVAAVSSRGGDVTVDESVREAIDAVRNDASDTNWAVVTYEDNNIKKPLTLLQSGSGTVSDVMALMEPQAVSYAMYRTTDVIDEHTLVRFVYIMWVGEEVKPMFKAKVSTHKGFVEDLFQGFHVALYANVRGEVTETILNNKIQSASGSKSHVK